MAPYERLWGVRMLESQTIFADEVLDLAARMAIGAEPAEAEPGVEASAILRSFAACVESGLWSEQMAALTLADWRALVARMRPVALSRDEAAKSPRELAKIVSLVAVFLRDRMPLVPETAEILPKAALHIAMSVLSLLRTHREIETVRGVVWSMRADADENLQAELDAFEDMLVAWCPCDDAVLSARRFSRANLSTELRAVRKQLGQAAPFYFTALGADAMLKNPAWLADVQLSQNAEASSRERMEAYFAAASAYPWGAQKHILDRLPEEARGVWIACLNALPTFEGLAADETERRLSALSSLESALSALIQHDFTALDQIATRHIPESLMAVWYVIRALASIMQNQPWEDVFLRQTICVPPQLPFWQDLPSLYFYLRAQALCAKGAPEVALQSLQMALENDLCDVRISLAHAQAHLAIGHFGEARVWLTRAMELDTNHTFEACVTSMRAQLSAAAIAAAKHAPVLDNSLLELALELGDSDTFCEAALCWFDADLGHVDWLASCLAEHPDGCHLFTATLLDRASLTHVDALCNLADALDANAPSDAVRYDAQILQAIARIDYPDIAYDYLMRTVDRWKIAEKSTPNSNFWRAATKCIALGAPLMAFDELARTLAPDFAASSDKGCQLLKCLLAVTPRAALMNVQQALTETIGPEETLACFKRLKSPEPVALEVAVSKRQDDALPDCVAAPLSWLIWARAGAELHPYVSAEKPSPREIARTLMRHKQEKMPEPPKAEWIHQTQRKASDAFDV